MVHSIRTKVLLFDLKKGKLINITQKKLKKFLKNAENL